MRARITSRPELSTSATYVTAQARPRRRTAALRDPDSARIGGLCAASNLVVYALARTPFRFSLSQSHDINDDFRPWISENDIAIYAPTIGNYNNPLLRHISDVLVIYSLNKDL